MLKMEEARGRGRLLLSESKGSVRAQKTVHWMASLLAWVAIPILLFMSIGFGEWTWNWFLAILASFIILPASGVVFAISARTVEPLMIHENGVDNYQTGFLRRTFRLFEEIKSVDIKVERKWVIIRFWDRDRDVRFANSLASRKEDVGRESIREIAEILRSKQVELDFEGKAREWLFDV